MKKISTQQCFDNFIEADLEYDDDGKYYGE